MIPVIEVRVNGVRIGLAIADGFFSKYGNSDGSNVIGLVAEAYLVRKLRSMGYKVLLAVSHNIEIRRIERDGFMYDCVGDYGEVIEKMPSELKAVIEEVCEKGIDIRVEDDGDVPVYFNGRLLFKMGLKNAVLRVLSTFKRGAITKFAIFHSEFEPFLTALSCEILFILEAGASIFELPQDEVEKILDNAERTLKELGIHLEEDFDIGVKISNEKVLLEALARRPR
ncbi:MAG: hypothetical protein QXQ28_05580 [Candidatus Nezhaarchaeales archaeon]